MSPCSPLAALNKALDHQGLKDVAPFIPPFLCSLIAYLLAPALSVRFYSQIEHARATRHLAAQKDTVASPDVTESPAAEQRAKKSILRRAFGTVLCILVAYAFVHMLPDAVSSVAIWALVLWLPRFFYVYFLLKCAMPFVGLARQSFPESTICSRTGVRGGLLAAAVSATVVSLALFTKIEVFSWLTFTATVLFCSLGFSKRKSTFTNALFRKSLLAWFTSFILFVFLIFAIVTDEEGNLTKAAQLFERVRKTFYELKGLDTWMVYLVDWVIPAVFASAPGSIMSFAYRFDRRLHLDRIGTEEYIFESSSKEKEGTDSAAVVKVDIGKFPKPFFVTALVAWILTQAGAMTIFFAAGLNKEHWNEPIMLFTTMVSTVIMCGAIWIISACKSGKQREVHQYEEEWNPNKDPAPLEYFIKEDAELEQRLLENLRNCGLLDDSDLAPRVAPSRPEPEPVKEEAEEALLKGLRNACLISESEFEAYVNASSRVEGQALPKPVEEPTKREEELLKRLEEVALI